MSGLQDRAFLWLDRLDSTYWKGKAPPGLGWARRLAEYAKRHPVTGSVLQVIRFWFLLLVVFSISTLFRHEMVVTFWVSIGTVVYGVPMFLYNRWSHKRAQDGATTEV
jgi:hypothetical protein